MPSTRTQQALARLADLTPRQIAAELDRYIVGQAEAKKAVAIALRNRWRRQRAPESIREEISPNNIILIGPTGVGKTEIARRLAKLAGAPFIKVEASKFTEVGYVGRDVESMVRDLVESAIDMVRSERESEVEDLAHERVDERLLDLLLPPPAPDKPDLAAQAVARESQTPAPDDGLGVFLVSGSGSVVKETVDPAQERYKRTRDKLRQLLLDGKLEDREVEVEVPQNAPMFDVLASQGAPEGMDNISDMLKEMLPKRKKKRTVKVGEARRILFEQEPKRGPARVKPDGAVPDEERTMISAREARVRVDERHHEVKLVLTDAKGLSGRLRGSEREEIELTIPVGDQIERSRLLFLSLGELFALRARAQTTVEVDGERQPLLRAFAPEDVEGRIHERFARAASPLAFLLLGFPLALVFKSGNRMVAFLIVTLIGLFVYYPTCLLSDTLLKQQLVGPIAACWSGNALIAAIGLLLLGFVVRR